MKLKYIGLLVTGLAAAILFFFVNPSEFYFPKCPLYATTGIYCPGCGSQRALHDFLNLNFVGVLDHNPLFLFGILVLVYDIGIKSINKLLNKSFYNILQHKYTPMLILVIVLLFWILRNLPFQPFNWLAPN